MSFASLPAAMMSPTEKPKLVMPQYAWCVYTLMRTNGFDDDGKARRTGREALAAKYMVVLQHSLFKA